MGFHIEGGVYREVEQRKVGFHRIEVERRVGVHNEGGVS